jgi:ribosome-associated protein
MNAEDLKCRNFEKEFIFLTSRSGGPGGQNVNKVNTKVELRFSVTDTLNLSDEEKLLIQRKLKNKINKEGYLIIVSQEARSQSENKVNVTEKFYIILAKALTIPIKRRSTHPTMTSKIKRLESKKIRGRVKGLRRSDALNADE